MKKEQIDALEVSFDKVSKKSYAAAVIAKWYYALTDEERDYADEEYVVFVPYSRRARKDRLRREALREARERKVFLAELKKILASLKKKKGMRCYRKAVARAEKLISLFKIRLPDMISNETSQEYFFGSGWNTCLGTAVKEGKIPEERECELKDDTMEAYWQKGWNAAREELLQKFPEFSKAA